MLDINVKEQRVLFKTLVGITIGIIVLNIINVLLGNPSWQITRLIGVGFEGNFPTWFSSMLLVLAAFFAYKCSIAAKIKQNGKRMWQLLFLGLLGMSCDEVAQIHEHLGNTVNKYFFQLESIKHSAWVIILGPFVLLVMVIFSVKMKKYLVGSTKAIKFLALGCCIYICGAFLLEATINFFNHDNLEWLWKIENILEELFEMLGVVIIIKGLTEHYRFLLSFSNT